jgi:hypothetical protein
MRVGSGDGDGKWGWSGNGTGWWWVPGCGHPLGVAVGQLGASQSGLMLAWGGAGGWGWCGHN